MFSASLFLSFSFVIYSLFTAVDNPELCRVIPSIPPTSSCLFLSLSIFYLVLFYFYFLLFIFSWFPLLLFLYTYVYLYISFLFTNTNMSAIRLLCVAVATSARLGCVGLKGRRECIPPRLFLQKHLAHAVAAAVDAWAAGWISQKHFSLIRRALMQ